MGCDDGRLYAVNQYGTLKWSFLTGNAIKTSPAIGEDGTVYVGSYDGRLYAIRPDGKLKWSYKTTGAIIGIFS